MARSFILVTSTVSVFLFFIPASAEPQTEPTEEVHRMLDGIEQAWQRHDIQALERLCCDDLLAILPIPVGNTQSPMLANKKQILDATARIWTNRQIESHRFVKRRIELDNDVAFLELTVADQEVGRRYTVRDAWNVAVRQSGKWKMCLSTPVSTYKFVLVTEVTPDSPADRAGLQPGDIVYAIDGTLIHGSEQVRQQIHHAADRGPDQHINILAIRDNDYVRLKTERQDVGFEYEDRLMPAGGAILYGPGRNHPVKSIVHSKLHAYLGGDFDGYVSHLCPSGLTCIERGLEGRLFVATLDNIGEVFAEARSKLDEVFDTSSFNLRDVHVIQDGGVAWASSRISARMLVPEPHYVDWPSALELYVRKNGKWWLAASLPKRIEIGNHISSSLHRTPQQTAATEQLIHGRICGLGVQINATPEGLLIEKVVPGSGAELARLKSGEIIARIDGQATSGMGVSQAANLLLGEEGTRVKLRVRDGRGRERSVTVTRRAFDLSDVEHRMLPDNIGLLRISRFTGLTGEHTQAALEELMSQGMGALILDLRGNTGGVYDQIVRVADLLIDKSRTMWFTKSVKGGRAKPVKASMASMVKLPVVVLVNDETAGAELIAAAIARNHRGRIVGQTTSGLTEAKSRVVNPDGSSELVVQGRFLISPRRLITGRGITPDVPMPPSASEEEVLSKAIELLD